MNKKYIPTTLERKLALALKYRGSNFDALVMDLISKTEPNSSNMTRLQLGFPEYVKMYSEWILSTNEEVFFNKFLAKAS